MAEYSCNSEFVLVGGDEKRECQADGVWNGAEPSCVRPCPILEDPVNGMVMQNGFLPGSLASYSCDEGFEVKGGDFMRQCQTSGQWSGEAAVCTGKPQEY